MDAKSIARVILEAENAKTLDELKHAVVTLGLIVAHINAEVQSKT